MTIKYQSKDPVLDRIIRALHHKAAVATERVSRWKRKARSLVEEEEFIPSDDCDFCVCMSKLVLKIKPTRSEKGKELVETTSRCSTAAESEPADLCPPVFSSYPSLTESEKFFLDMKSPEHIRSSPMRSPQRSDSPLGSPSPLPSLSDNHSAHPAIDLFFDLREPTVALESPKRDSFFQESSESIPMEPQRSPVSMREEDDLNLKGIAAPVPPTLASPQKTYWWLNFNADHLPLEGL